MSASHDGYIKAFGVIHRRHLFATADGFAVRDRADGGTRLQAEVVFQLAPAWSARLDDGQVALSISESDMAVARFDVPGDVTLARGGELGEGGGWVSPAFGIKVPAVRISWRGQIPAAGLTTCLSFCA